MTVHLALPWRPKHTCSTAAATCGPSNNNNEHRHRHGGTTTAGSRSTSGNASANCCGLSKLMRRLKKSSNKMLQHIPPAASRQSSFQCRYDPLSYSLNFDTSGSGNLLDEDYYKFYAFSSRFVATPRSTTTDCQRLVLAAASH